MITVTAADFQKLVGLLKKEGMDGAYLTFTVAPTALLIKTMDRSGKEMQIELADKDYPFMPRVTKTETF